MTCVVGVEVGNSVILGADSSWGTDDLVVQANSPKAFRMGALVFGFAGSYRLGLAIRHRFAPEPIGKDDLDFYMNSRFVDGLHELYDTGEMPFPKDSQLVVGIRGALYEIDRQFAAVRSCGYLAIGVGAIAATGSLYTTASLGTEPRERLRLALETAAAVVPGVCPPFTYVENAHSSVPKTRFTVVKSK